MRTPDDVFNDFQGRRRGILKALTTDVDKFFQQSDPERENLCLYGHQDGSWEVDLPAEEVPPELPEPALGINFARDGMQRRDWLALVAVHSDTWLIAVAFYNGARLNKEGRERLFSLINELPTCYEVVSGKAAAAAPANKGKKRAAASGAGAPRKQYKQDSEEDYEEDEDAGADDDGEYGDGDGDPCPNCGRKYRVGDFWIACDFCDTWYDGKCVQMTPGKAERMGKWKCPQCK